MTIGVVSFRSANSNKSTFDAMLRKPQAYSSTQQPVASTSVRGGGKKKGSLLGTIAKLCVAAGVVAGALALGSHFKILKPIAKNGKVVKAFRSLRKHTNSVIAKADQLGAKICTWVNVNYKKLVPETVQKTISETTPKITGFFKKMFTQAAK